MGIFYCIRCICILFGYEIAKTKKNANLNLSCSREKEATAKQAFTFLGAIPTKSKVRSTTGTEWLDFGGGTDR